MINDNYKLEKFTHPFPYIKINNFLNLEFFKALELSFPKVEEFKSSIRSVKRMDYDTSYGDNLYNDLIVKNECQSLEYHLKETSQKEGLYNNTIKSLNRKKNQLIDSIDDLVAEKYNFVTPDPESIIVFTGSINE